MRREDLASSHNDMKAKEKIRHRASCVLSIGHVDGCLSIYQYTIK